MATYEDKLTLDAFNGKLGKPELIKSETLTTSTYGDYNIDISDVDWDSWDAVIFKLCFNGTIQSGFHLYVMTTGAQLDSPTGSNLGDGTRASNYIYLVFLPMHNAENEAKALVFPGGTVAYVSKPYTQMTGLRVMYRNSSDGFSWLSSGTYWALYGMR